MGNLMTESHPVRVKEAWQRGRSYKKNFKINKKYYTVSLYAVQYKNHGVFK
jgi:hypothetical protein